MMMLTLIALAGAAGAVARFAVDRAVSARVDPAMPLGTVTVNLSGSLLLGLLVGSAADGELALVVATGFLGAYTTFSTWMYESLRLIEQGAWRLAMANLLGAALSGPPAAAVGLWLGRLL